MAELILVSSGKGGVGKTTVCAHLGVALSRRGCRTLVVETDAGFRTMDLLFALDETVVYDLGDILAGRCAPDQGVVRHPATGLSFILAPGDPLFQVNPQALADLCTWARGRYDYVLFDGSAGFGPLQQGLAPLCDLGLLVTLPQAPAARAAGRASLLLRRSGLGRQRLVINRVPDPLPRSGEIRDLDDVIDAAGVQLIAAVPEEASLPLPGAPMGDRLAGHELDRLARRLLGEQAELVLCP